MELRKKKIHRPTWKSLSLTRKDRIKSEESTASSSSLFRSPSLFDSEPQANTRDGYARVSSCFKRVRSVNTDSVC